MMKYESRCAHCGKPCLRSSCPKYRVKAYYCDKCKDDTPAVAEWDGEDFCKSCLDKKLNTMFVMLPIEEKIEALQLEDEIREV